MKIVEAHGKIWYWCMGCGHSHSVPPARWHWNGDYGAPTLHPSVRHYYTRPNGVQVTTCHYFVRNGIIQYCGDCTHALRGTQHPLIDVVLAGPESGFVIKPQETS